MQSELPLNPRKTRNEEMIKESKDMIIQPNGEESFPDLAKRFHLWFSCSSWVSWEILLNPYVSVGTGSRRLEGDGIGEGTDFFDLDRNRVTGTQPAGRGLGRHADALRCASQDDGAGDKGRTAAEVFNQRGYVEDHVAGVRILHAVAVEERGDAQCVRVRDLVARYK